MKKEIQRIFLSQIPELLEASCFLLIHSGYWAVIALRLFKDRPTYSNTKPQVSQFPGQTRAAKTRTAHASRSMCSHTHIKIL